MDWTVDYGLDCGLWTGLWTVDWTMHGLALLKWIQGEYSSECVCRGEVVS